MKRLLSAKQAGFLSIIIFSLLILFHLFVLVKIIPSDIVWGGKLDSSTNIFVLELLAISITILFIVIIAVKIRKESKFRKLVNILVWIIFAYMVLNTLANLASSNSFEKAFFSPVTFILAFLTFRVAIEK